MNEDPRKTERDLIENLKPPLNQMGADEAKKRLNINEAVKAQLRYVHDQIDHYVPMKPRGWGDDSQMPHEWGSMDTYDDMRNSVRFLSILMDDLCNPMSEPNEVETFKRALMEGGFACSQEVEDIIRHTTGLKEDEDLFDWLDAQFPEED